MCLKRSVLGRVFVPHRDPVRLMMKIKQKLKQHSQNLTDFKYKNSIRSFFTSSFHWFLLILQKLHTKHVHEEKKGHFNNKEKSFLISKSKPETTPLKHGEPKIQRKSMIFVK